ncbi:MAG: response regulator [Thermoanaerobaculia bacterium]|nr:response regulator [Thermoanaerobaculia bacterium]
MNTGSTVGLEILVIEDHRDAALGLQELLEIEGHRVTVVEDGESGLAWLREHRADVVICDLGLPGMGGLEVAREIRGRPELGTPSLLALSGRGHAETRDEVAAAGFDGHLVKPVDLARLQELLASVARTGES